MAFADGRRATTLQPDVPDLLPEGVISEWKPTKATVRAWTILSIPITAVALLGYTLVAVRGDIPVSWSIDSNQILLIVALTLGLGCIHEGVHGIAMLAFGAKPEFGVLKIGRMIGWALHDGARSPLRPTSVSDPWTGASRDPRATRRTCLPAPIWRLSGSTVCYPLRRLHRRCNDRVACAEGPT
jgi:hypothetical protein